MPAPVPSSRPDSSAARTGSGGKSHILTLEATGVLIIALILLVITLVRHWHGFAWSVR